MHFLCINGIVAIDVDPCVCYILGYILDRFVEGRSDHISKDL